MKNVSEMNVYNKIAHSQSQKGCNGKMVNAEISKAHELGKQRFDEGEKKINK